MGIYGEKEVTLVSPKQPSQMEPITNTSPTITSVNNNNNKNNNLEEDIQSTKMNDHHQDSPYSTDTVSDLSLNYTTNNNNNNNVNHQNRMKGFSSQLDCMKKDNIQKQSPFHHITQSITHQQQQLSKNNQHHHQTRPHSLPIQINGKIFNCQDLGGQLSPSSSSIRSPLTGSTSPSSSFAEEEEEEEEVDGDQLRELPKVQQCKSGTRTPSPRSSVVSPSFHDDGSYDSLLSSGRFSTNQPISTILPNNNLNGLVVNRSIESPSSDLSISSCSPSNTKNVSSHHQQIETTTEDYLQQQGERSRAQSSISTCTRHTVLGVGADDHDDDLLQQHNYRKKSASFIEQATTDVLRSSSTQSSFNLSTIPSSSRSSIIGDITVRTEDQVVDEQKEGNQKLSDDNKLMVDQNRVLVRRVTVANTPSLALDGTVNESTTITTTTKSLSPVGISTTTNRPTTLSSLVNWRSSQSPKTLDGKQQQNQSLITIGSTGTSLSSSPANSLRGEGGITTPQRRLSRSEQRQSLSDLGYGKIESYFKLQKLGKGTYATVYQGRSRLSNELVALKEILKEHDEGAPCTAIREVSLLRLLRHNNIVTLHDICHTPDKLTLVFEYVGQDLYAYMKDCNYILGMHNVRLFLYQLLRGLSFCHSRQVLHRDLKPQNLLINRRGELKICDFGLARAKSIPTKSYSNEVVTLWYRPPDVLLGNTDYDHSIDMWGVGCIFFEMASGRTFFPGSSVQQQLYLIFSCMGTPNKYLWPDILDNSDYQRYNFPPFKPEKLIHRVPRLDLEGMSLLMKFLKYRPSERISSDLARHDPFFSSLPDEVHKLPERESIFSLPGVYLTLNPGQRLNHV